MAGRPHVVAHGYADSGHVVTVPIKAPCYACAAPPPGSGSCSPGLSIALGALAAAELLLILAAYAREPRARRIVVANGGIETQPTAWRRKCPCSSARYL